MASSAGTASRDQSQGVNPDPKLAAREPRVFRGKLDKRDLSIAERAIVAVAKAPSEDQRDWEAIRLWAAEISAELPGAPLSAAGTRREPPGRRWQVWAAAVGACDPDS